MGFAGRRLAAAVFLVAAVVRPGAARAADKVRCAASYEEAQELRRRDALSEARRELLVCEEACPASLAGDCKKWRADVEALTPAVRLVATDPQGRPVDARVLLDGAPLLDRIPPDPVPVDPGDHTFRFVAATGESTEVQVSLQKGDRRDVNAVLAPAAPPPAPAQAPAHAIPLSAYLLGGVGAAGLAVAGVLTIVGHVDAGHLRSSCAPGCDPQQVDAVQAKYDAAWVTGGIGLLAAAAAVVVWVPWRRTGAAATAGVFVAPTPGGATVGLRVE